jgi:small subunit ribosomal protein S17
MADETPNPEEETTAEVAEGAEPTTEPAEETPAEPEVVLSPKERRQARRSAAVAKRGPRRASTPEERTAERKRKAESRRRYRAKQKEKRAGREVTPPLTAAVEETTGQPKLRTGIVVSDKADKTITVRIETARRHRRYQKTIRSSSTLHAHDEANTAGIGDRVRVIESRPLSRNKRWRLVDVLEKAK